MQILHLKMQTERKEINETMKSMISKDCDLSYKRVEQIKFPKKEFSFRHLTPV